jgi:hypothetical protein
MNPRRPFTLRVLHPPRLPPRKKMGASSLKLPRGTSAVAHLFLLEASVVVEQQGMIAR